MIITNGMLRVMWSKDDMAYFKVLSHHRLSVLDKSKMYNIRNTIA
jgi:hypothetical protein